MIKISEENITRQTCKKSFFQFVLEFWSTLTDQPPIWNWHIKYLCDEMQIVAERVFAREPKLYDLIINVPPGSTKSSVFSEMLPAWVWTRMPSCTCICGSYSYTLSLDLASKSRRIMESDKYKLLFPEITLDETQKIHIKNNFNGERIATSVGGSITGMHADIISIDDPMNPQEAVSDVQIKSANEWVSQTLLSRKKDKAVTPLILIMQRLHQNDTTAYYQNICGGERIKNICLPAEATADIQPAGLRRNYVNGLLDPIRLSQKICDEFKKQLGEFGYAGQFLQKPVPRTGGMFKFERIIIENAAPTMKKIVRYWDKAGTKDAGAYTAGVKLGQDLNNFWWILDVVRGQWEAAERERIIRQTAALDTTTCIIGVEQEPGSGGKESAQGTVLNLAGYSIRVDRPTGDKALRADPFSVQVNGGNVRMLRGEWNNAYLNEMQYFPVSKYKDQIDASSGAFSMIALKRELGGL